MTDTTGASSAEQTASALSGMKVADLQTLASQLGIRGAARLRKSQLIDAIQEAKGGAASDQSGSTDEEAVQQEQADAPAPKADTADDQAQTETEASDASGRDDSQTGDSETETPAERRARRRRERGEASAEIRAEAERGETPISLPTDAEAETDKTDREAAEKNADRERDANDARKKAQKKAPNDDESSSNKPQADSDASGDSDESPMTLDDLVLPEAREERDDESNDEQSGRRNGRKRNRSRGRRGRGDRDSDNEQNDDNESSSDKDSDDDSQNQGQKSRRGQKGNGRGQQNNQSDTDGDDDESRRGNRQRDRKRGRGSDDVDPEIAPDDVLLPIAGILDVLDNYAFVRTSGYLPGGNDVYVSLGQVKKYGLRKGDAIVGAIRQPREGEQHHGRQKYNAIVKLDSINGQTPEESQARPQFDDLTAQYPQERLKLETPGGHVAQRIIDLFAPIGLGARGLIVAPPKTGKSVVLERIANAVAENSPETHLMLVLVDERPEEVTRMQRTIHGEVVAATFDLPAEDQTTVAELALERAKRLVELGLDVVVLVDSLTRLCRAYNVTAPASGRVLDGGVDASALYPAKRFFGAARNVENGGSLTILATVPVETGSRTDEVVLEEFAGTENMEICLSREIADRRIFPALDIQRSSTLQEETLLTQEEVDATWSIRRALTGSDPRRVLESVLERLDATDTNAEFVQSVRTRPIQAPGVAGEAR